MLLGNGDGTFQAAQDGEEESSAISRRTEVENQQGLATVSRYLPKKKPDDGQRQRWKMAGAATGEATAARTR